MNSERWPIRLKEQVAQVQTNISRILDLADKEHRPISQQELLDQVHAWRKIIQELPPTNKF